MQEKVNRYYLHAPFLLLILKLMFQMISFNLRIHIGTSVNQTCSLIQLSGIALYTGFSTEIAAEE
jgi:hypothetical protein